MARPCCPRHCSTSSHFTYIVVISLCLMNLNVASLCAHIGIYYFEWKDEQRRNNTIAVSPRCRDIHIRATARADQSGVARSICRMNVCKSKRERLSNVLHYTPFEHNTQSYLYGLVWVAFRNHKIQIFTLYHYKTRDYVLRCTCMKWGCLWLC